MDSINITAILKHQDEQTAMITTQSTQIEKLQTQMEELNASVKELMTKLNPLKGPGPALPDDVDCEELPDDVSCEECGNTCFLSYTSHGVSYPCHRCSGTDTEPETVDGVNCRECGICGVSYRCLCSGTPKDLEVVDEVNCRECDTCGVSYRCHCCEP